jgi:hypothetical protein
VAAVVPDPVDRETTGQRRVALGGDVGPYIGWLEPAREPQDRVERLGRQRARLQADAAYARQTLLFAARAQLAIHARGDGRVLTNAADADDDIRAGRGVSLPGRLRATFTVEDAGVSQDAERTHSVG